MKPKYTPEQVKPKPKRRELNIDDKLKILAAKKQQAQARIDAAMAQVSMF